MSNDKFKILESLLLEKIKIITLELRSFLQAEPGINGMIGCGVWSNENMVSGGILYTPHSDSEEESINIDFGVTFVEENKSKVDIRLEWSYGRCIKIYFQQEVIYKDPEQFNKFLVQVFDEKKEIFLSDMKTEMRNKHEPYYL